MAPGGHGHGASSSFWSVDAVNVPALWRHHTLHVLAAGYHADKALQAICANWQLAGHAGQVQDWPLPGLRSPDVPCTQLKVSACVCSGQLQGR